MAIAKNNYNILEPMPVDSNIPSLSSFFQREMGYYLYALEDKWVFPFKYTEIKLNIGAISMPDDAIGIISGENNRYRIETTSRAFEFHTITVTSKKLLPFKIRKGDAVAILSIVPTIVCHVVEQETDIEN